MRCVERRPKPPFVTVPPQQVREPRANIFATSFTWTRAEARERVLPRRLESDRSHNRSAEATPLETPCRSRERPLGLLRGEDGDSTCRSRLLRAPSPEGCLPPTGHRSGPQAQDTQREISDVSHGVRFLSTYEPRRSLCRFTSPTPSAHRVSHPLSVLSPPGPRGFVSRHIRP